MKLRCKNTEFHGNKPKYFEWERLGKGADRKYCHEPDCIQDMTNKNSNKSHERNKEAYKTVHHRYRKKGTKDCLSFFCPNKTDNRFGYCDSCITRISSEIDSNYMVRGKSFHNGSPMI